MGLLGSAFPLSFRKTQAVLQQLLGIEISRGAITTIRERISATLERPLQESLAFARVQPLAYVADGVLCASVENGTPPEMLTGSIPMESAACSGSCSPLWWRYSSKA